MAKRRWWSEFGNRAVLAAWRRVGEAGRITAASAAGRRFAAFGEGSAIAFPQGTLLGERWISIGHFTLVGPHVTLSAGFVPERDLGPEPIVRIGSGVVLGRGSHVIGHQSIEIGDDVYTGPYVYITDQNHGYADPEVPIGKQWPVNAPVSIGAGSWLGTGSIVLPGATIGRNVVVAAGSVVRGHVPDHCVVGGVPARVIRRYSGDGAWVPAEEAASLSEAGSSSRAASLALPARLAEAGNPNRAALLAGSATVSEAGNSSRVAPLAGPATVSEAGSSSRVAPLAGPATLSEAAHPDEPVRLSGPARLEAGSAADR